MTTSSEKGRGRPSVSAQKSSVAYPFCCRAREKAENCISVRACALLGCGFPQHSTPLIHSAPKPVTRHIVIAERPAQPTQPDTASDAAAYQNSKREAYPEEVLTHRFRPYGDLGDLPPKDRKDVEMAEASPKEKKHKRKGSEIGSSKKKKAKVAGS